MSPEVSRVAVWMDVDPAAGLEGKDVDDALALIQAFHSPELDVRGVSVVYGNASFEQALPIGREVAERFGPPALRVVGGATSAHGLGQPTAAVAALAEELRARPLTILALGPVTTIASLVQLHPELHGRIERIVMVAARRVGQRFTTGSRPHRPFQDFNFESDPAAMHVLLESDIALEFAPWEVSSHVFLRRADLELLGRSGACGAWIARKSKSWLELWAEQFDVDGFNPFDTLAVGWVTHPALIAHADVAVWIEEGPDDRVDPTNAAVRHKPYLLVDPDRTGGRRACYCTRPDPAFMSLLLERLK